PPCVVDLVGSNRPIVNRRLAGGNSTRSTKTLVRNHAELAGRNPRDECHVVANRQDPDAGVAGFESSAACWHPWLQHHRLRVMVLVRWSAEGQGRVHVRLKTASSDVAPSSACTS